MTYLCVGACWWYVSTAVFLFFVFRNDFREILKQCIELGHDCFFYIISNSFFTTIYATLYKERRSVGVVWLAGCCATFLAGRLATHCVVFHTHALHVLVASFV
jgi:hypothetical protein